MKVEVGKYYLTREGKLVSIVRDIGDVTYPFEATNGRNYTREGGYWPDREDPRDLIAEWSDTPEVGTLQEIGAQVGDVVAYYWDHGCVTQLIATDEMINEWITDTWRIISRANQSPVREVTTVRKEIVPGVYGRVEVWDDCSEGGLAVDVKPIRIDISCMAELTAAIATLTLISDAMADSSGDTTTTQAR